MPKRATSFDHIDTSIKKMWGGCVNQRFANGDCLEWAVAIHGVLTGSEIHFIFEPPSSSHKIGDTVKCHFLVKHNHTYYDHEGIHTRESWKWNPETTIIQRVTPDIVRSITQGASITISGHPPFTRTYAFNETLCGTVAQEFILHYQPPIHSNFLGVSVSDFDAVNW